MIILSSAIKEKWTRFKSIKRGYISLLIFIVLIVFSLFAELFINNRALLVYYNGNLFFPTYGSIIPGKTFGFDYDYETNYKDLYKKLKNISHTYILLPPVPYNAYETDLKEGTYPPYSPSIKDKHYLGTDTMGRDVLARLVYGFRIAIIFSLILLICNYIIGIFVGSLMGYFGGWFDLLFQRIIEIWSNIPFLYVVIIISALVITNFFILAAIMVFFGWIGITWYIRTIVYKEKAREYIHAARALGASHLRIMFKHILPNAVSVIVTFIPFSISSGITSLTALDYLGFGLPPPTPSWGELLSQGTNNLDKIWIASSVVIAMVIILTMVTFIGEAIREAFDPKKFTTYE